MAIVSTGITLSYKLTDGTDFIELLDLQEIPELGGSRESIEITVLKDEARKYTDGILNYGDSLAFKFLYEKEQFATLNGITNGATWKVTLPEGETCTFAGSCNVKLNGVGVNAPLTYTLSIKPSSKMEWA